VAVLAATARLLDELALDLDQLPDRLAVGHLRRADIGFDAELALHPVDEDLEVELAHSRDDRLSRFLVRTDAERRIFLRRRLSAMPIFSWSALVFGSTATWITARGDHLLERDHVIPRTERVARRGFLQTDRRRDVAGADFLDFLAPDWRASGGCGRGAPCAP